MTRKFVPLDANIVRVSRQFGERMVWWYDSPEGKQSLSRSRSGDWGAERDPVRLGQSKAGEYAVALYFGLDLATAVKRKFGVADDGCDVLIGPLSADVKTTSAPKKWLLWSRAVNDLYWQKNFDTLIGVSIDDKDWSRCWIEGWISKAEFFERKQVADGVNDRGKLTAGVEKASLHDIAGLEWFRPEMQAEAG